VEAGNFLNRVPLVAANPVAGAIIRGQLSAAGYDVHWARNRVEAGVLWQPSYYDVVLLDLRRDPREGEDFAHRIKATDPGQRIIFLDGRDGTKEAALPLAASIAALCPWMRASSTVPPF
jgi:DNA-binding response OmpR family regulator